MTSKVKSRQRKPAAKKSAPKAPAPRPPFRWGRLLTAVLRHGLTAGIWAGIAAAAVAAYYALDLPDVEQAFNPTRQPAITLLSEDGATVAAVGEIHGLAVRLAELPAALPQAVLATEDRRFYHHFGIDPIGLARALWVNLRAGQVRQGASTITQQVAKNLFLNPERTIKRKVQELLLALWLEGRFSKDQILTVYLNRVYLGTGVYGVDAAARRYFGKPAAALSTYQAAMIAGLLKAPSRYNPLASPARAAARTRQVLANMVAAGYLSEAQAARAEGDKHSIAAAQRSARQGRYFADWVLKQVPDFVPPGDRDLVVETTLDRALQGLAERHVRALLAGPGAKAGIGQAAVVAMAPDGAVRAMVGGGSFSASPFNRATQARRQPGSAFKPVVYLAALEAGFGADSPVIDGPIIIDGWAPRNFSRTYQGPITLLAALSGSVNSVAVKLGDRVGFGTVAAMARRLGITAPLAPHPSLALGTAEISLLEMTAAYAVLANGGYGVLPHGMLRIKDGGGGVLYQRRGSGQERAIAPGHVAAINQMLAAAMTGGTGQAAQIGRPAAGKTGTSQDYRDAWFIGFTADLVLGVWLGNDDGKPMSGVTGGGAPARLWGAIMADAHRGWPQRPLADGGGGGPPTDPQPTGPVAGDGFWSRLFGRRGGG